MPAEFIQSIIAGILKLALFLSLIVLGVVFVPENFVNRIKDFTGGVQDYVAQMMAQRLPDAKEGVARQAEETKEEARNLYQKFQEEQWSKAKAWLIGKF